MGIIKTAREKASADLEDARKLVARWEAEEAAVTAELADLESRAGDELLDDETAAGRLPAQMGELRDRVALARAAAGKAGERAAAAERCMFEAEAAEWDAEADKALRRVTAHQAKIDDLLRQLDTLDNAPFGRVVVDPDVAPVTAGRVIVRVSVTDQLWGEVVGHRVKANVIRAHLNGVRAEVKTREGEVGRQDGPIGFAGGSPLDPADTPESVRAARAAAAGV